MSKYHITPSLSMILAKPRTIRIDNAPVKTRELSVIDLAPLEDRALKMFPHPLTLMSEEYEEYKSLIAKGEKVVKNKTLRKLYLKIEHSAKRWPPKLGTIEFSEYLATSDGMNEVLWHCVGRANKMKRIECDKLFARLKYNHWRKVSRIAWGRTVEIPLEQKKEVDQSELSEGIDWQYEFYELETKRGWTRDYILQMPISHFLSSISRPRDYIVEMDDARMIPGPSVPVRFH
jgi:hypothetical protein